MRKLDRRSLALVFLAGLAAPAGAAADSAVSVITGGSNVMVFGTDPAIVVGNGKIERSERAIGAATELDLDGAFLATITLGAGPSLVIEGDENVLPFIKSEATGDKLHIFAERSYRTEKPIRVILSLPALARLSAGGSNSVALTGVAGPTLALSMNGSNSVSIAGRIGALSANSLRFGRARSRHARGRQGVGARCRLGQRRASRQRRAQSRDRRLRLDRCAWPSGAAPGAGQRLGLDQLRRLSARLRGRADRAAPRGS